jgi:hypothetical protein
MEPVPTLPLETITVDDPVMVLHDTPAIPLYAMKWQDKPLWKSRTWMSLALTVIVVILGFFGIEGAAIKEFGADNVITLGEVATGLLIVAAHFFNYKRTGPLTLGTPKPPTTD